MLVDHLEPMLNAVLGYGDLLNFFSKLLQDATQIETIHSKNKEIQIALKTMFRIAKYPFRVRGGHEDNTDNTVK